MKQFFKNVIGKIKNKFSKNKVTLPKLKESEIVNELNIFNHVIDILNNFMTEYPHLYKFNDDRKFWACFFTAMAYCESSYNRFATYLEPAPLYYESLGLFQLSYVDKNNYPFCDISGEKIFQVYNNTHCAIGIMNKLMRSNSNPISAGGKYWSILQPRRSSHKKFLAKLDELLKKHGVKNGI